MKIYFDLQIYRLMLKFGIYWLNWIHWLILIPIYIFLGPLCLISSDLFDWTISWLIDDQTVTLIIILVAQWAISAFLILQLMIDRAGKNIFFYEFVFFLVCGNFILIGITYSLIKRDSILEEFAAKICTTLLLILLGQKMKVEFGDQKLKTCEICYEKIDDQSLQLKCSHLYHQQCLWKWIAVKAQCPQCRRPVGGFR